MTNLQEVAAFLLGEGELDGVGFGDPHPTERGNYWWRKHLRAALAQPEPEELGEIVPANEEQLKRIAKLVEPEPVAWRQWVEGNPKLRGHWMLADPDVKDKCLPQGDWQPLYTAPPQREWQGLTDQEQLEIMKQFGPGQRGLFADAIEAKLKEKNEKL